METIYLVYSKTVSSKSVDNATCWGRVKKPEKLHKNINVITPVICYIGEKNAIFHSPYQLTDDVLY